MAIGEKNNQNQINRSFLKQAKIGNGKAYSIFSQNRGVDFTDEIIDISIHNYGYDPQCEGDRADYAFQFIRELEESQKQKVLAAIKNQLAQVEITDDWDVDQLFKLAALLSKEYDAEFGELLRNLFDTCSRDELWQFPEDSILLLDGFDGMVRLARRIGKMLLTDDDWLEADWDMHCVPGMKFEEVKERLTELSKTDENIKAYLDEVNKDDDGKSEKEKYKNHAFEITKEAIANKRPVPRRAYLNLSHEELCYFADEFKKARTQNERRLYLNIFSEKRSRYPYSEQDLIDSFSPRKNSWYNNRLVDCLACFSSPAVREVAQKALDSDEYGYFYLQLLINNYREGDSAKIVRKLKRTKDECDFHWAVGTVRHIYEKNITADCLEPLMLAYKTRCGICRQHVVELMEKAGVLSDEIRTEFLHDAMYLYDKRTEEEE
ncbi:MAG: hypothetical protein J6X67_12850 [Treponema sp.]|nr:hypothetical protein [Treponema sp.]